MSAERSFASPKTFSDEHIERWAPVFLAPENRARLRLREVRFETFLLCPEGIMTAIKTEEILLAIERQRVIVTSCGLLPAQRDVQRRIDLEHAMTELAECAVREMQAESHCADGRWTAKIRHHRFPRSQRRRITNTEA